jgi:hypothetical protein
VLYSEDEARELCDPAQREAPYSPKSFVFRSGIMQTLLLVAYRCTTRALGVGGNSRDIGDWEGKPH